MSETTTTQRSWWRNILPGKSSKSSEASAPQEEPTVESATYGLRTGPAPGVAPAGVVSPQLGHNSYVLFADLIFDRFQQRVMESGDPIVQEQELEILLNEAEASARAASPVPVMAGSEAHRRAVAAELSHSLAVEDQRAEVALRQRQLEPYQRRAAETDEPSRSSGRWTSFGLLLIAAAAGVALAITMAYSIDSIFIHGAANAVLRGEGRTFIAQAAATVGFLVAGAIAFVFVMSSCFITVVTVGDTPWLMKGMLFMGEIAFVLAFAMMRNVAADSNHIASALTAAGWELSILLILNVVAWAAGLAMNRRRARRLAHAQARRLLALAERHLDEAQTSLKVRQSALLAQQTANQRHAENQVMLTRSIALARAATQSAYYHAKAKLHGRYVTPPTPNLDLHLGVDGGGRQLTTYNSAHHAPQHQEVTP